MDEEVKLGPIKEDSQDAPKKISIFNKIGQLPEGRTPEPIDEDSFFNFLTDCLRMFLVATSLIGLIWVLVLHLEDESNGRNRQREKQNDSDNSSNRERDSVISRFL